MLPQTSNPSSNQHIFSKVPHADIQRSVFDRSHTLKTTINGEYLYPIYVDEALPGDTFNLNLSSVARFNTLLTPIMDNVYLDFFFFAVPNRLVWDNWQAFMGEHDDKGPQDTDYVVPQVTATAGTGWLDKTLYDYMGVPILKEIDINALHPRAYSKIYDHWFRDQNLIDSIDCDTDDGPDADTDHTLLKRAKRHDYFSSCLPWPQKGDAVDLPLGSVAPVTTSTDNTWAAADPALRMWKVSDGNFPAAAVTLGAATSGNVNSISNSPTLANPLAPANLVADLSNATASTINSLREAFQLQVLMERDARGGTRYTEIIKSHFGVTSPDARLQRPEYLGGGTSRVVVTPIANTFKSGPATGILGELGALATSVQSGIGFTKSFTEHCVLIGLVNLRSDVTYQQGLNRMWSRQTKYDYYWPALAHLGEQEVYNKEIFAQGTSADDDVFGYQERFAEYRYLPSLVTSTMRSDNPSSLDSWHLALDFSALPVLNQSFIEDDPPFDRVSAVTGEDMLRLDCFYKIKSTRPMPLYSIPGLIDHF